MDLQDLRNGRKTTKYSTLNVIFKNQPSSFCVGDLTLCLQEMLLGIFVYSPCICSALSSLLPQVLPYSLIITFLLLDCLLTLQATGYMKGFFLCGSKSTDAEPKLNLLNLDCLVWHYLTEAV